MDRWISFTRRPSLSRAGHHPGQNAGRRGVFFRQRDREILRLQTTPATYVVYGSLRQRVGCLSSPYEGDGRRGKRQHSRGSPPHPSSIFVPNEGGPTAASSAPGLHLCLLPPSSLRLLFVAVLCVSPGTCTTSGSSVPRRPTRPATTPRSASPSGTMRLPSAQTSG